MSVFRIEKNNDFTILSNYHFRDKNLSLKAKGLLSLMLSLPEEWDFSMIGLVQLSSDGCTAVRTALKELEKFRYLKRRPIRDDKKIIDWEYLIYERPLADNQEAEKLLVENQKVDNQIVENHTQLNTKKSKTKKSNTKIYNKGVESFDFQISDYSDNEEIKNLLYEFIKMRKAIKKPLTEYAFKRLLSRLSELAQNDKDKISVIDQSLRNSWQDFYELRAKNNKKYQFDKSSLDVKVLQDSFYEGYE